ncbi:methyl-accepting chemotaxis protein [Caballeronia pedi]|uniref:methyl-accepting chemotaxis protein n=1 Tax=Caballeronia pedi TaxID=1777141 RepID=UPI000772C542|nr:methyl-accepting chemotaxis protein [Caballeronia pedi]
MNFKQMTVRARLTVTFSVLVGLVLIVSGWALSALGESNDRFIQYVKGISARAQQADLVRMAVDRRAIAARNLVLVTKPQDLELEKAAINQAHEDVQARLRQLKEMVTSATDTTEKARSLVADMDRIEAQYGPVALAIENAALNNRHEEAISMMNEQCRPLLASLITATNAYSTYTRQREEELLRASEAQYARARMLLISICMGAAIVAAIAGFLITRSLTRALGAEPDTLSRVTRRVAEGDLSHVDGAQTAPAGSVMASMGVMQASLVKLIGEVRIASDNIATGSSQIASGNQDLSSRTEQQASSLQETASSMEELTSTVKQNAENAQQASALAANASEVAQKGSEVVSNVVQTMGDINESSTKVAEITGIIEGIAFQTNILALNAAVEAARAGEQGRGFAVVASEVRSLAQRSSSAAKEIKDLINASVQKIQDGSVLAGQAGTTMNEVTQAVARVTDIMGEIAAASDEQSRGIEQVNLAVTQMDEVTQQNAALVEEAAAASQSLETQGRQLTQAVAFFRLDERDRVESAMHAQPTNNQPRYPRALAPVKRVARPAVSIAAGGAHGGDWQSF